MVSLKPLFSNMLSLFVLLLFHFGCFPVHRHDCNNNVSSIKKRLITSPKKRILSFFKALIPSSSSSSSSNSIAQPLHISIPSPSSSTRSLRSNPPITTTLKYSTKNPNHDDYVHPCHTCGEVFAASGLLHLHQCTKHAITEHSISNIERCIADGNELLRFYCATYTCNLSLGICAQKYCSVCGIVRNGFSPKADGISLLPTSWKAHVAVPEDIEDEFAFMGVKRALLLCRVVAGRVGSDSDAMVGKEEDPKFESLMGRFAQDELVVVNPRAVLPCFVVLYNVV